MSIQVVEACKNYVPPIGAVRIAQLLLNSVPQEYHRELAEIVLTNSDALSRQRRREKVKSGSTMTNVRGVYYEARNGQSARIDIFIDKTLHSCPPLLLKLPIMQAFVLSEVLYHEIGHHIQFLHGRSSGRQQEKQAEQHERQLFDLFLKKHYWYAWPLIATIRWVWKGARRHFLHFLMRGCPVWFST